MPAKSEAQRRFFGAELGRLRRGERTETGLPESKLREFARKTDRKGVRSRMARRRRRGGRRRKAR